MNPLVSIIIPSFNSEKTIRQCLESIYGQSYKNYEVILIDGLSTDTTVEIVKTFPVKWISERDLGVYDAMNKGIEMSSGQYLYFMGSDDIFYSKDTLNTVFGNTPTEDIIYGNVKFKKSGLVYSGESNLMKLVRDKISICHQAIFYSRRTFEILGQYDINFFIHADHEFNIRCFNSNLIKTKYLNIIVSIFNEFGLSGLKSNADGFSDYLTRYYAENYFDVCDLYLENLRLKDEIKTLTQSNDYKYGSLIMYIGRKVRAMFK